MAAQLATLAEIGRMSPEFADEPFSPFSPMISMNRRGRKHGDEQERDAETGEILMKIPAVAPAPEVLDNLQMEEIQVQESKADQDAPKTDMDQAVAASIHQAQIEDARRQLEEERRRLERMQSLGVGFLSDPIWGDFPRKPDVEPTRRDIKTWNLCPCAVVGCGYNGQRLWKRYLLSLSVFFATIEVVIFGIEVIRSGGFEHLRENTMIGPRGDALNDMGAKNVPRILQYNEWWRLFTPMFLHAGVVHLGLNVSVLLRASVGLELIWGRSAWLIIYIVSGLYATLASCIFSPSALSVESSGGLFGIIAARFIFHLIKWDQAVRVPLPDLLVESQLERLRISVMGALIFFLGFLPFLNFATSVGGFVMGGVLALIIFARTQPMITAQVRNSLQVVGLLLLVGIWVSSISWFLVKTKSSTITS
jgi:membrane associated rhomboid family serine protease